MCFQSENFFVPEVLKDAHSSYSFGQSWFSRFRRTFANAWNWALGKKQNAAQEAHEKHTHSQHLLPMETEVRLEGLFSRLHYLYS